MVAILNFAFLKIPERLKTYFCRDIIAGMLAKHNQSRKKKYISQNQVTPLGCRTISIFSTEKKIVSAVVDVQKCERHTWAQY